MNRLAAGVSAIAMLTGCASTPPPPLPPPPQVIAQLAPTGVLRVAVLTSNPVIGTKDASGELKGTTVTLARALAAQAGVPAKMIEYRAVARLLVDATINAWDVAVVPVDPARRAVLDFAPPHLVAGEQRLSFALPRKRPDAGRFVAGWVEEAKASGAVQRAIDAAGAEARVAQ
jgi:extracellular solute-binding protein (family 3)